MVKSLDQALIDHLLEDPSEEVRWTCASSLHFDDLLETAHTLWKQRNSRDLLS